MWKALMAISVAVMASGQGLITQRNLSLGMAKTIAEAALSACKSKGFSTAVAVVDRSGQVLVILRDEQATAQTAERPRDRYEDYIVPDLFSDAEAKFPIAKGRANRAIAGISMGGFGAIKIALSHPDVFSFVGALSPALDVPRRPFSMQRIRQSWTFRSIFGPSGSEVWRRNDPFFIAQLVPAAEMPYMFLSCGDGENLLPVNRDFAAVLEKQHLAYEFHVMQGGHDWEQWDKQLPSLFARLFQHMGRET